MSTLITVLHSIILLTSHTVILKLQRFFGSSSLHLIVSNRQLNPYHKHWNSNSHTDDGSVVDNGKLWNSQLYRHRSAKSEKWEEDRCKMSLHVCFACFVLSLQSETKPDRRNHLFKQQRHAHSICSGFFPFIHFPYPVSELKTPGRVFHDSFRHVLVTLVLRERGRWVIGERLRESYSYHRFTVWTRLCRQNVSPIFPSAETQYLIQPFSKFSCTLKLSQ